MGRDSRTRAERSLIADAINEVGHCEEYPATEDLQGHHRIPKSVDPSLTLERSNIVVLCAACHARKHPDIAGMIERPRRRKGVTIICATCGKPKYVKASRAERAQHCSIACRKKGEQRECEVCGTGFYKKRKFLVRGEGRFCSLRCFGTANGPIAARSRWRCEAA
jgi:HNH endonuclease